MDGYEGADEIERAWRRGLAPDPLLTVSEWADRYRVLSQRASSEPGRWRTERTPYLKEIMDCLSPASPYQRVVLMKGAQIGGTECGNCWIGYVVHQAPGPMMAVSPSRAAFQRLLDQGWIDAIRTLHPGEPMYTFWDYKRDRWRRNAGLRLDHLLLSPPLVDRLTEAGVDRDFRGKEGASCGF